MKPLARAPATAPPPPPAAPHLPRRAALAGALLAALTRPLPAAADVTAAGSAGVPTAYFGSGCFWGRQKDFFDAEKQMGRAVPSAVTGYAGGAAGADDRGRVCYYYANDASVYERRGHAEVVRVALSPAATEADFRAFARLYFRTQFVKRRDGRMQRQDPLDAGPGYRNVVGIPGGVRSPLFKVLEEENVNGMTLIEGKGTGDEPDLVNTVYVVDSDALPFYAAESWHQYHDGIGHSFGKRYKRDAKRAAMDAGAVPRPGDTGCPEFPFL